MSATLELQAAIVAALRASPKVKAIVGNKIYDRVPPSARPPYISLGPEDTVQDDAECITSFDVNVQIDAWSDAVGQVEAKRMAEAVRLALHDQDLPLGDAALVSLRHRQTRVFTESDGLTSHAAIEIVALVEQP